MISRWREGEMETFLESSARLRPDYLQKKTLGDGNPELTSGPFGHEFAGSLASCNGLPGRYMLLMVKSSTSFLPVPGSTNDSSLHIFFPVTHDINQPEVNQRIREEHGAK
uniref:Uncharacterized protein n=1 Tax=Pyricularia oryzae (strain P131) TaxID=1143193 RepID=L7ITV0_PYRO1